MKKHNNTKGKLKIAGSQKTSYEIYSIVLRGVTGTLKSLFKDYYVSDNIEALMKHINEKKLISAEEYKLLLAEAKDFYPVIICALFVQPLRDYTKNFKLIELNQKDKKELFDELQRIFVEYFAEWLCIVELDPLLFYRLALSYKKQFNLQLYISNQHNRCITALEERVLKLQLVEIVTIYLIEQVALHLGLAGLDYLDFYKASDSLTANSQQEII